MFVRRSIDAWVVYGQSSIAAALKKSVEHGQRVLFCVDENGRLTGAFSSGDFRRWLLAQNDIDLTSPVISAANPSPVAVFDKDLARGGETLFRDRISAVPVLDDERRIVGVALARAGGVEIDGRAVGDGRPCYLVAEIGNNHNGDVALGKTLIELAAEAGADAVKFQMRIMSSLMAGGAVSATDSEDLGSQYVLGLLDKYNLAPDAMFSLFDHCKTFGVTPICTPFDLESAALLLDYGLPAYKIASADLSNEPLLRAVMRGRAPMIISTGMSTEPEIEATAALVARGGAETIFLHCNSTYPTPYEHVKLRYLNRLRRLVGGAPVGYSGHEPGWFVPLAAVTLGACLVEKHFTIDRSMHGNDHKVSLLPSEFEQMARAIRHLEAALGDDGARSLSQGEHINRETLGKSVVAAREIAAHQVLALADLELRSPGRGLAPIRLRELVGKQAPRAMPPGAFFFDSDVDGDAPEPRAYQFSRPWGLPVRYHDWRTLYHRAKPALLEFHLSYGDLDLALGDYFDAPVPNCALVVHCPEMFDHDHLLNLASPDDELAAHSLRELARTIEATRALATLFPQTTRPLLVTNIGGFSREEFLPASERPTAYERLKIRLAQSDLAGVELIPQTMPPFPWHFGGQQHHNLFVDPDEIVSFCQETGFRICLDTSHSKLACNHFGWSFSHFLEKVGPHTAHVHIADARGTHDEGLQIGDGEIDFHLVADRLRRVCPDASFIPEIWQGHKNGGEGFWRALEQLEGSL